MPVMEHSGSGVGYSCTVQSPVDMLEQCLISVVVYVFL